MTLHLGAAQQQTAHQSALTALRRAILTGELAGGTRLVQTEIAASLGLSITPVREALRQLATEGLIRFDSYRGAVVQLPDAAELSETYEIASALTPLLTAKAADRATDEDIETAASLHEEMLTATDDVPAWVETNRRFHAAIYGAAHSPRLFSIVEALGYVAAPLVARELRIRPELLVTSNEEHAQILAAFSARDAAELERRCLAHLDLSLRPGHRQSDASP